MVGGGSGVGVCAKSLMTKFSISSHLAHLGQWSGCYTHAHSILHLCTCTPRSVVWALHTHMHLHVCTCTPRSVVWVLHTHAHSIIITCVYMHT